MTQNFKNILATDYIDTGLLDLKDRDMTALTAMSGSTDPTDPPEDAVTDNTTEGVLKLNGDVLIDYKNGFLNSTLLAANYQPLNSVLTDVGDAELETPCIVTTDGEVIELTGYGTTVPNMTNAPGVGAVSKRDKVNTALVSDGSVTMAKLSSDIARETPFKVGSLLYTFSNRTRSGFLKLVNGATVGSSSSNATYRRNDCYNLFAILWAKSDAVLYGFNGQVVSKGASASEDFASNKAVLLPQKTNYDGNEVLTASGTYSFPHNITGLTVTVVGAGGSGGGGYPYHGNTFPGGGGGSGGKVVKTYTHEEVVALRGQTISYTVGVGGAGVPDFSSGNAGGNTTFDVLTATGGGAGGCGIGPGGGAGGSGSGGDVTNGHAGGGWTNNVGGKGFEIEGTVYGSGSNGIYGGSTQKGGDGCILVSTNASNFGECYVYIKY